MKNNNVGTYIFGFISGYLIINVIDSLYSLFSIWVQALSVKPAKIINEHQKEVGEYESETQELAPAIGFAVNNDVFCDCEE